MSGCSYTAEEADAFDRSGLRRASPSSQELHTNGLNLCQLGDLPIWCREFFFFLPLSELHVLAASSLRRVKLHVPSPQQELPDGVAKEDEEAEEGWTSSADGHDPTQGTELLTTPPPPPPPSTGEQTEMPPTCQTHRLSCQPANLFAARALSRGRYRLSKSVRGCRNTN